MHVRGVAEVTGYVRADVRGRGQSPVPLAGPWTELRRASQRFHATDGVAAGEDSSRQRLEFGRDRFVRLDGRLRQVPGTAIGLVRPRLGQRSVCRSTFFGM